MGVVQIVLGGLFFSLLLFGTHLGKFPLAVALLMLLIVIGERVAITPAIELVSRHNDLNPSLSQRAQFASDALSYGYKMAEWAKFAFGAD